MKRYGYLALVALANLGQGWFIRHPRLYKVLLADGFGGLR